MDEWRVECGDAADDDVDGAVTIVMSLQSSAKNGDSEIGFFLPASVHRN